jgi:hypothetical protein
MSKYASVPEEHIVYFLKINDHDIVKVGRTNKLQYRLMNITQSLWHDFTVTRVPCCCSKQAKVLERTLHHILVPHRIKGEWYHMTAELMNTVIQDTIVLCPYCL